MDDETWAPVHAPYSDKYEISTLGRIRRTETGRVMKTHAGNLGYIKCALILNGKTTLAYVHRLVARTFVPGDQSLDVNHKDMDKSNNRHTNLEWISHAENIRHGMRNHPKWVDRLRSHVNRNPVIRISPNGKTRRFKSIKDAALSTGGPATRSACIHHAITTGGTSYGSRWSYA